MGRETVSFEIFDTSTGEKKPTSWNYNQKEKGVIILKLKDFVAPTPKHKKVSNTKTRYWIEASTDCYRRLKHLQYGRDLKYDWLINFPIVDYEIIKSNNTNAIVYGHSAKELDLQYFEKAIVYHYIRKYGLGHVRCPHISAETLPENRILQELEVASYRNDYSDIVFNADL